MTIRCADCWQRYPSGVAENSPDPNGIRDNWREIRANPHGPPTYVYAPMMTCTGCHGELVDDDTGKTVQRALTELEQHQVLDWAWGKGPKPMLFEVK